jgi:diguanylate cyclase (GGDEF)-like protein
LPQENADAMSQLVEHLAELTGYRDRDVLDVTLVGTLVELLRPLRAGVYRSVGDRDNRRWLTRARQGMDDPVVSADPLWTDLQELPKLEDYPLRAECLNSGEVKSVVGGAGEAGALSVYPLATDRDVVGVVELHTAAPLTPDDARLVAGILRVYRNFQGLLDYSERDTLTGLLNRKTFEDGFLRCSAAVARHEFETGDGGAERRRGDAARIWVGVIDIDHFKAVNDSFGHLIGDEVLLLLSRLMRGSFRWHDQLFRFGGEEFVVLLRANEPDDAARAFERLRQAVQDYAFPQVGHITVSSGFTEVRSGDTPAAAFERADKAVYYAKQSGRNRVASYHDLVASGVFVEDQRESDIELF